MVVITGGFRAWIKKRIRIKSVGNTFVGEDAGKVCTGDYNSFAGYQAGMRNVSGYNNNFIGALSGYSNTSGIFNNFMGYISGYSNITGHRNCFIGSESGYTNTDGEKNTFVGYKAGYLNTIGLQNTFIGMEAGYSNIIGERNVSLGYSAGAYETGDDKFFIDNRPRTNEADGRIKALVYGIFDAAIANQLFRINGKLELTTIKSGATQAGAGAAANEVWKTASHASLPDNVLMIGV